MSKTEIVTSEKQRHDMTNEVNRAVRHCRIGKVTEKRSRHYGPLAPQPMIPALPSSPWFPGPFDLPPLYPLDMGQYYPRKCSCKRGTSCNNAACPNRLIVTCGVEYGRSNPITTSNRLGLDAYGPV